jgi:hypothetical protein
MVLPHTEFRIPFSEQNKFRIAVERDLIDERGAEGRKESQAHRGIGE